MKTKALFLLLLAFFAALPNRLVIADDITKVYHMQNSTQGSHSFDGIAYKNKLVFTASPCIYECKYQLWQVDSLNNPQMIADFNSCPRLFFILNNELFFFADCGIWHYNGIDAPSLLINNYCYYNWFPSCKIFNNKCYFQNDYYVDNVLYEFDGVHYPKNIGDDVLVFSDGKDLNYLNGKLYFVGSDSVHGRELWCYDGNQSCMVADLIPGLNDLYPGYLTVIDQKLFFYENNFLWQYDGIQSPEKIAVEDGRKLIQYKNKLYFTSKDSAGSALFAYDGINSPVRIPGTENIYPRDIFIFNEKLYFNSYGYLYEYNGSDTVKCVINSNLNLSESVVSDSCIYSWFSNIENNDTTIIDFYKYNGTSANKIFSITEHYNSWPTPYLFSLNNQIYVRHSDYIYRIEEDTIRIICYFPKDITEIGKIGDKYYFASDDQRYGKELWYFDGNNAPEIAKDINDKQNDPLWSHNLKKAHDKLYFKDNAGQQIEFNGKEYKVLPQSFNSKTVYNELEFKNYYYYNLETGRFSSSLFKSNGTAEQKLSNDGEFLTVYHDTIYFSSYIYVNNTNTYDHVLMKYDGVHQPTEVANFKSGMISKILTYHDRLLLFVERNDSMLIATYDGQSFIRQYDIPKVKFDFYYKQSLIYKNILIFALRENSKQPELWMYDGLRKPGKMADVFPELKCYYPGYFVDLKNKLYFSASDSLHGKELWEYDGINSPKMVKDIIPGTTSSSPEELVTAHDKVYFSAYSTDKGKEIWSYDGTNDPEIVQDLYKGSTGSIPMELTVYNGKVYFTAAPSSRERHLYELNPDINTLQETACDSFDFNGIILKESGCYYDTLTNSQGSDSILKLDLTIIKPTFSSINLTVCNEYNSISGKYKWTISSVYRDTISNAFGCDSIITINLNVNHTSESSLTVQSCNSYISPGGKNWRISGTYKDTIPSSCGCDSILTINLQIDHVDTAVIQDRNVLVSADLNASHQWIDAENNLPIQGETYLTYTPDHNGKYAVIVTQGTCVDTSSIFTMVVTGNEMEDNGNIQLYPNPTNGNVTIDLGKIYDESAVTVMNSTGMVIQEMKIKNTQKAEFSLNEPGMYLVKIRTGEGETIHRVIKQ